jgi:hypothetical protein
MNALTNARDLLETVRRIYAVDAVKKGIHHSFYANDPDPHTLFTMGLELLETTDQITSAEYVQAWCQMFPHYRGGTDWQAQRRAELVRLKWGEQSR